MKLKFIVLLSALIALLQGCDQDQADPFQIERFDVIVFNWSRSFDDAVTFIARREENRILFTTVISDGIGGGHPIKEKSSREISEDEFHRLQELFLHSGMIGDAIDGKHQPVVDGSVWAIACDAGNLSIEVRAHSPSPTESAIGKMGSLMIEFSDMEFSPEKIY